MAQRDHEFWAGNKGGCYPKEVLIGELPVTAEVEVLKAYLIQVRQLIQEVGFEETRQRNPASNS